MSEDVATTAETPAAEPAAAEGTPDVGAAQAATEPAAADSVGAQGLSGQDPEPSASAQGLSGEADEGGEAGEGDGNPFAESLGAPEGDYSTEGIQLPEGMTIDEGTMQELGAVCREHGLSQKVFSSLVEKMSPVLEQRQAERLEGLRRQFLEDGRKDPEIGGARWKETMNSANAAYRKFANADAQKLLQATGLNCHPAIIRMFKNINAQISDDAVMRGRSAGPKKNSLANLYNNSNMN
jgi:hypothetical protein